MSEIQRKLLPIAQGIVESSKLNLELKYLKIFKTIVHRFHEEQHREVEEIGELTPETEIFVEANIEHSRIGETQLLLKGFVDKRGELQFVQAEIPIVPIDQNSTATDKSLKKNVEGFLEHYQAYLATTTSSIINLSISIMRRVDETKKVRA